MGGGEAVDAQAGEAATASPPASAARLRVTVMHSPAAGLTERVELELDAGSRVADALRTCGAADRWPSFPTCSLAIWNRRATADHPLRDGDRIDVLRPLTVDPKESRRQRYRKTPGRQGGIERSRPKGAG
jgi:uncharacterized protein